MSSTLVLAQESISASTGTPPARTVTITPLSKVTAHSSLSLSAREVLSQINFTPGMRSFLGLIHFLETAPNILFYSSSYTPRFSLGDIYHLFNRKANVPQTPSLVLPCRSYTMDDPVLVTNVVYILCLTLNHNCILAPNTLFLFSRSPSTPYALHMTGTVDAINAVSSNFQFLSKISKTN